jgi:hypothetical protein
MILSVDVTKMNSIILTTFLIGRLPHAKASLAEFFTVPDGDTIELLDNDGEDTIELLDNGKIVQNNLAQEFFKSRSDRHDKVNAWNSVRVLADYYIKTEILDYYNAWYAQTKDPVNVALKNAHDEVIALCEARIEAMKYESRQSGDRGILTRLWADQSRRLSRRLVDQSFRAKSCWRWLNDHNQYQEYSIPDQMKIETEHCYWRAAGKRRYGHFYPVIKVEKKLEREFQFVNGEQYDHDGWQRRTPATLPEDKVKERKIKRGQFRWEYLCSRGWYAYCPEASEQLKSLRDKRIIQKKTWINFSDANQDFRYQIELSDLDHGIQRGKGPNGRTSRRKIRRVLVPYEVNCSII